MKRTAKQGSVPKPKTLSNSRVVRNGESQKYWRGTRNTPQVLARKEFEPRVELSLKLSAAGGGMSNAAIWLDPADFKSVIQAMADVDLKETLKTCAAVLNERIDSL